MYNIADYGDMLLDRVRMEAYAQALRGAVRPGAVVVDIGTGTGIFALLACRFGARRVYAIEPDDAIEVAREIAAANHCAGQIEFFRALSTRVTLPETADVIVSDLRGVLPFYGHSLKAIADARRRFLGPGGTLIPLRDTLWAAVVEVPRLHRSVTSPWSENGYGLDLRPARQVVTNMMRKARVKPEEFLTEPKSWATLDYTSRDDPNAGAELNWTAARPGTAHGLCVWFDATLTEGVSFSNAPGAPEMIYGQMFFPWAEPVALAAGDAVTVDLRADLAGEDYLWRWKTCVRASAGQPKASFKQSTFFGAPLAAAQLRKCAASYVPSLDEEGQIDRLILSLMDGATSQEEIARRAAGRFPARFARWEEALTRVGELSQKYTR